MNCAKFLTPLLALVMAMTPVSVSFGADPPVPEHPAVTTARQYVMAIISRDWKACSTMLSPKALETRYQETLGFVKDSHTMSEESAKLAVFGIATYGDLEKLGPAQFYVTERTALNKKTDQPEDSIKRQLDTLKIDVLAVGSEDNGHFYHVVMRTHRETPEMRVHELLLISLLQDARDDNKWWVVPDTQLPVAEPLDKSKESGKDSPEPPPAR